MDVTARATYYGKWWVIEVPEVDGALSQARRLDQVAAQAADAVGLLEDVAPESVRVTVVPILPDAVGERVEELRRLQSALAAQQAEASALVRSLVHDLQDDGLTVRDIGQVVGVSPQRVSQLSRV